MGSRRTPKVAKAPLGQELQLTFSVPEVLRVPNCMWCGKELEGEQDVCPYCGGRQVNKGGTGLISAASSALDAKVFVPVLVFYAVMAIVSIFSLSIAASFTMRGVEIKDGTSFIKGSCVLDGLVAFFYGSVAVAAVMYFLRPLIQSWIARVTVYNLAKEPVGLVAALKEAGSLGLIALSLVYAAVFTLPRLLLAMFAVGKLSGLINPSASYNETQVTELFTSAQALLYSEGAYLQLVELVAEIVGLFVLFLVLVFAVDGPGLMDGVKEGTKFFLLTAKKETGVLVLMVAIVLLDAIALSYIGCLGFIVALFLDCLLYTSPSPRDRG